MQKIHLISNAHLDPVWLWRWDEGAAEAVSTFRVAADFCEQFDGFVFNHNEAILYQWVEEYEPALFARIQKLVREGKWNIMGGWYLQPDCNMPTGESMIRQIEVGRRYFAEKFGVIPTTAVNVDSFGHSRGLVQVMAKTGYDSYLFCRPLREFLGEVIDEWGFDDFTWAGYDGSQVTGHRHYSIYNSKLGKGAEKLENYFKVRGHVSRGLMLWGIGDHGGGPSRIDLTQINELIRRETDREIVHSTPEAYFAELRQENRELPWREKDLNSWAVGCYTTQAEIKRKYRQMENEMFSTEKMLTHAAVEGLTEYPADALKDAEKDMLFAQFHDILPGTVVPLAMEDSLRTMDHGLEIISRKKAKAFFLLAAGQPKAADGEIPIMAYNPHPYEIEGDFECEFHMNEEFSRKHFVVFPAVYQNGVRLPCQLEQEACQMPMQWRRKVAFHATLKPMQMNRFDCRIEKHDIEGPLCIPYDDGHYRFDNGTISVEISTRTGLMESYRVNKVEYLKKEAFRPLIIQDDEHTIGTFVRAFPNVCGEFKLLTPMETTEFCGVYGTLLEPVHLIEDGEVRTILEAAFGYNHSRLLLRYILPKRGAQVQVQAIVHWNETNKMLKLSIPTVLNNSECMGQVMYGYDKLPGDGRENVSQHWVGVADEKENRMLSIINDHTYGSSFQDGELRVSLLRAPRYGCLVRHEDRWKIYNRGYVPHTDQGVHSFCFWMEGGNKNTRLKHLEREAQVRHEQPYMLSFFPCGDGTAPAEGLRVSGGSVVVTGFKKCEYSDRYMVRLYNGFEEPTSVDVTYEAMHVDMTVAMGPFEVKTLVIDQKTGEVTETDMLEDQYQK